MELILHFSVHCANIRVFCENAKGLGVFFLKSTRLSFLIKAFSTPLSPLFEEVFSKTYPSFLTLKEGSTSLLGLLPSGKKRKPLLPVALNRCALRLAGHQSPRQDCFSGDEPAGVNTYKMVMRDGTTGRLSYYSTFDRITSGVVPIRVIADIL